MSMATQDDSAAIDQSMEEITADSLRGFMRDMSGTTMRDISNLIAELETLRARLQADGSRAQREILEYAQLGQSATQLVTIASKSMADVNQLAGDR